MQFVKRWRGKGLGKRRTKLSKQVKMDAGGTKTPAHMRKGRNRAAAKRAKVARRENR